MLVALSALSLAPGSAPRVELPSSQKVGGLALEDLHGRLLENAVAGRLFVVSGRLRNPSSEPVSLGATVRVTLLGEHGRELGTAPGVAGLAPSEASVREESPDRLQERLAASAASLAWTPLRTGRERRVSLRCVENVPLEAQSFALAVQPADTSAAASSWRWFLLPNPHRLPRRRQRRARAKPGIYGADEGQGIASAEAALGLAALAVRDLVLLRCDVDLILAA